MRNRLLETLATADVILTEGGLVERIRRAPGVELDPFVAHAGLIYDEDGRRALSGIYREYIEVGRRHGLPFLSLAPTWRANPERLQRAGLARRGDVNGDGVRFMREIRDGFGDYAAAISIAGLMACRGDAYRPEEALAENEAARFHQEQADALAAAGVDCIKAATLPALSEALGMATALSRCGVPYVLSFVVRPTGRLLDGAPLDQAIDRIDASVSPPPSFYMINCVHPTVFEQAMDAAMRRSAQVAERVLGLQANTSALSPDQLDGLDHLDSAEPAEFGAAIAALHERFGTKVLGGCCGSDTRHVEEIAARVAA